MFTIIESPLLSRNSAMPLSEKELLERDAQRDIGAELLQAIRDQDLSAASPASQPLQAKAI